MVDRHSRPEAFEYWLDEVRSFYNIATAELQVGTLAAEITVEFSVFDVSRHGCHVYWSLPSLIRSAGLRVVGPKVGQWIGKHWRAWVRMLGPVHMDSQLLQSQQYEHIVKQRGLDVERVLPFASASSPAGLYVLCVLAFPIVDLRVCKTNLTARGGQE